MAVVEIQMEDRNIVIVGGHLELCNASQTGQNYVYICMSVNHMVQTTMALLYSPLYDVILNVRAAIIVIKNL